MTDRAIWAAAIAGPLGAYCGHILRGGDKKVVADEKRADRAADGDAFAKLTVAYQVQLDNERGAFEAQVKSFQTLLSDTNRRVDVLEARDKESAGEIARLLGVTHQQERLIRRQETVIARLVSLLIQSKAVPQNWDWRVQWPDLRPDISTVMMDQNDLALLESANAHP